MVGISIQQITIQDIALAVKRNYYDWGRERGKGGKKDLVDKEEWDDASPEQRQRIAQRGYALYDGCPVPIDNALTALDAWACVGFRSRVIEYDVIRFLARADQAQSYLAEIPVDARLEEATDAQLKVAANMVECLKAPWFGIGKATKILHKKRPDLIPVLDSVVSSFLWTNFTHLYYGQTSVADAFKVCRTILQGRFASICKARSELADHGFKLTPLRVLDWVMWLGWENRVGEDGYGPSITSVWGVESRSEAKRLAAERWKGQSA